MDLPEQIDIYLAYVCLTIVSFIILTFIALIWVRTVQTRLRTDEILERYEILKATNDSISTTIGSLLSNLLRDINDTNELLNQIPSSSREGQRLSARLIEEQKKIQSPEISSLLIRAVNDTNDGVVDLFKSNFPDLTEKYTLTFALCAAKVAPQIASLILDIKPKTFYVRRDRLRDTIANSENVNHDVRDNLISHLNA